MYVYIGVRLYGYCNGYFGRESYKDKRIEAVGNDWIVVRSIPDYGDEEGIPDFCRFEGGRAEMERLCQEWSIKPPKEEP